MINVNPSLPLRPAGTNACTWSELPSQRPSIEHQRGVGKFLGEKFPSFLREVFPLDFANFDRLEDLIAALRSYIVLDDYAFDRYLPQFEQAEVKRECNSHLENARQVLRNNGLSTDCVELGRRIIDRAKTHFDFSAPIHSVLEKCWYVLLPVELASDASAMREPVRQFICEYLTLLQLFDDFQDIAEDIQSPANHNIFVSNECLASIPPLQLQVALIPSLRAYGLYQVSRWRAVATRSKTASGFISYARSYLNTIGHETKEIQAPGDLFDCQCLRTGRLFKSTEDLHRLRATSLEVGNPFKWQRVIPLIRAELIHRSYSSGKEGNHV
jgi:hypothetical protein